MKKRTRGWMVDEDGGVKESKKSRCETERERASTPSTKPQRPKTTKRTTHTIQAYVTIYLFIVLDVVILIIV